MTASQASAILKALASGQHPKTDEPVADLAFLTEPEVIRALFLGASALDEKAAPAPKKDRSHLPHGAGRAWDEEEEAILREEFNAGKSILAISEDHSRTEGGIRSRLVKLGLMTERDKDPR